MTDPDRDTAANVLHHFTFQNIPSEGVRGSQFFTRFMLLLDVATEEEMDRLSRSHADLVAAYRLGRNPEGLDLLRQLAFPTQT